MIAFWRNTLSKSKRMIIEEEVKISVQKQLFWQKKRIFTDLCLLVWINPQMSSWLCEYKNRLFHIVRKSCKSKRLTAEVLVTYHQTFFFIYMVAVHSWWHLKSFQQYTHPKLLIFQASRIWCSRIFEAKNSRNLLKQFKNSLESDLISTQKLCFECVQTFGARICQLVNGMEENTRNTKVKNLVQRATNWIWTM